MRLAGQDAQRQVRLLLTDHRPQLGQPCLAGSRQDELPLRVALVQDGGRGQKDRGQVLDLGLTAAGQQCDDHRVVVQVEHAPGGGAVDVGRNLVGQRMADVGGGDAGLAVDGFLEGKDQQHVVDGLADLVDALASPGPDRRADEVVGAHAGGTQLHLQAKVEIGRIDADEGPGRPAQQALTQLPAHPQQARQCPDGGAVAVHGQPLGGPPGLEALGLHAGAADAGADRLAGGGQLAPAAEHRRGQQVARGFAGDEADLRTHGQRAMPRVTPARNSSSGVMQRACMASVSAICCKAARASASDSPCRYSTL